jgi:Uma2 family endonuclease
MSQVIEVVERYIMPEIPDIDLPEEDGVPLESNWHRIQINLLIDIVQHHWRQRQDFFVGGNMFIYYSLQQARQRDYKGPDFFLVKDIDGSYPRQKWVVWQENGRYPDVIIELLSPSTAQEDLGRKKGLYERTFRTAEYFCYDPDEERLWGWRLSESGYVALDFDENSRLWSGQLDAWLGTWDGDYQKTPARWLRLFDTSGQVLPTAAEAARQEVKAERQHAEAERQRAEVAEAELARLKEEVARLKGQ